MRVVLVVFAAVLLLTGCATTIPSGPKDADLERFTERTLAAAWSQLGRPGDQPVIERLRYITNEQYVPVMSRCVDDEVDISDSDLAWYTCQAMYPVTPSEYRVLSDEQVDYLYDYRKRWTVPCLALHGYAVELIDEDLFRALGGLWNPLYSSQFSVDVTDDEYAKLDDECGIDVVGEFPQ